jgi:hypothetical protein
MMDLTGGSLLSAKKETEGKRREGVPGCCWADCSWALGTAQVAADASSSPFFCSAFFSFYFYFLLWYLN